MTARIDNPAHILTPELQAEYTAAARTQAIDMITRARRVLEANDHLVDVASADLASNGAIASWYTVGIYGGLNVAIPPLNAKFDGNHWGVGAGGGTSVGGLTLYVRREELAAGECVYDFDLFLPLLLKVSFTRAGRLLASYQGVPAAVTTPTFVSGKGHFTIW